MTAVSPPLPPDALLQRGGGAATAGGFLRQGREIRDAIVRSLPEGYDFRGRRVLEFGCGIGRVLRHFVEEAERAEFWGCDIDDACITWLRQNYPPSFQWFTNSSAPALSVPSGYFDLVYAVSVFTHLTAEQWEPWLLELRRVLKPDGLAILTFHNRVAYEYNVERPFDEKTTGMWYCIPTKRGRRAVRWSTTRTGGFRNIGAGTSSWTTSLENQLRD